MRSWNVLEGFLQSWPWACPLVAGVPKAVVARGGGSCFPPHSSPGPQTRAHLPTCLPRAILPGAREQQKFNYRYLFFQPPPQPVFGRLEQGNSGPLPHAFGNNTVFRLCLGLCDPQLLWGRPLGSHWAQAIRDAGGLQAAVPSVPQRVLKFGALQGHGVFGIAVGARLPLVARWVLHVAMVPAPVLAVAVMGGPPRGMGHRAPLVGFLVVPIVFGTAWLVVTVLLGLVPSWRSLLPSANQRGRTERVTGWVAQRPCVQTLEEPFTELSIYLCFQRPY